MGKNHESMCVSVCVRGDFYVFMCACERTHVCKCVSESLPSGLFSLSE